jgi:hypothetical protein
MIDEALPAIVDETLPQLCELSKAAVEPRIFSAM